MKVCSICGYENESEQVRCSACRSLLPEEEIISAPVQPAEHGNVKICDRCAAVCNKNAIRCEKCGTFLKDSRSYTGNNSERNIEPICIHVDSGEIITLSPGQIIGRQYQPEIWDAYTSRAAYKVLYMDGKYVLEDLKKHSVKPVVFDSEYRIGRKKMKISNN